MNRLLVLLVVYMLAIQIGYSKGSKKAKDSKKDKDNKNDQKPKKNKQTIQEPEYDLMDEIEDDDDYNGPFSGEYEEEDLTKPPVQYSNKKQKEKYQGKDMDEIIAKDNQRKKQKKEKLDKQKQNAAKRSRKLTDDDYQQDIQDRITDQISQTHDYKPKFDDEEESGAEFSDDDVYQIEEPDSDDLTDTDDSKTTRDGDGNSFEWENYEKFLKHKSTSALTKTLDKGQKFELFKMADNVPDEMHIMIVTSDENGSFCKAKFEMGYVTKSKQALPQYQLNRMLTELVLPMIKKGEYRIAVTSMTNKCSVTFMGYTRLNSEFRKSKKAQLQSYNSDIQQMVDQIDEYQKNNTIYRKEKVKHLIADINKVDQRIQVIIGEDSLLLKTKNSILQSNEQNERKYMHMAIGEIVMIIAVLGLQVRYIQNVFANRSVI